MYQISLLLLPVSTVWLIIIYYQIQVFHKIVTYILIFVGCYGFKAGVKGLKATYHRFLGRRSQISSRKTKTKSLTRRRVTHIKTREEAQW